MLIWEHPAAGADRQAGAGRGAAEEPFSGRAGKNLHIGCFSGNGSVPLRLNRRGSPVNWEFRSRKLEPAREFWIPSGITRLGCKAGGEKSLTGCCQRNTVGSGLFISGDTMQKEVRQVRKASHYVCRGTQTKTGQSPGRSTHHTWLCFRAASVCLYRILSAVLAADCLAAVRDVRYRDPAGHMGHAEIFHRIYLSY